MLQVIKSTMKVTKLEATLSAIEEVVEEENRREKMDVVEKAEVEMVPNRAVDHVLHILNINRKTKVNIQIEI